MSAGPEPGFRPVQTGGEFIAHIGPLYVKDEADGRLTMAFRVERQHTNAMRVLHGGMMSSFCDMLVPMQVQFGRTDIGPRYLPTISLQIDYLSPVLLGAWVTGRVEILHSTSQILFAQGLVHADGALAARLSGVYKVGPPMTETR